MKNKKIKVLIGIILFIVVIVLVMFFYNNNIVNNKEISIEDCISIVDRKQTTETIMYIENDPWVIDIVWELPQLKFDTEDAKNINQELKKSYENNIKSLDVSEDKTYLFYQNTNYENSCINNIFSLKVIHDSFPFPGGDTIPSNKIYNFDAKTGKLITNEELLKKLGIKSEVLDNKINEELKRNYDNYKNDYESYTEYYNQCDFSNMRLYIKSQNEIEAYFIMPSDYGPIDTSLYICIN